MSSEVRCPECRAKMRLDDEPAADEAIECPRCGTHFAAAGARVTAAPKKKRKEAGGADKPARDKTAVKDRPAKVKKAKPPADPSAPKKKRAKKRKSNKTVLGMMIVTALVILAGIGTAAYILFGAAGKVESLLVHLPGECNWARGVNSGHLGKYAGYKSELERGLTGPLGDCWNELAAGLALSTDYGTTPEYAVMGKVKNGGTVGTVYVYRTRSSFDPKVIGSALGGAESQAGGQTYYTLPARAGQLGRAAVYAPSDRILVVVAAGPRQAELVQKSAAGKQNPEESFWGKIGKTGRKVSSGHLWVLIRADGDLRNYISELVKPIAGDFHSLAEQANKSTVYGQWTSFGAKMTFGAAIACGSAEEASKLADEFKSGPFGQGDETIDPPNSLRQAYGSFKSKDMSEFRSNLKFYATGDCAYLESRMTHKDKANQALSTFTNTSVGDQGAAGGGGFGPPPGGRSDRG